LHPSAGILTLEAAGFGLTDQDEKLLFDLSQKNGLYHIRIHLTDTDFLESSIPACQLVGSGMKAKLVVSVNDQGSPIAIHLAPSVFECSPAKVHSGLTHSLGFTLDVQRPTTGASPETFRYLQRLEKQREEMARAEKGDNRSFFAKYVSFTNFLLTFKTTFF
uniref:ER membrane protein complex subunit 10 n=1 Tax=Echinostoma caproni TaxID=27848 RepID=A0A183BDC6_9TREM